MYKWITLGIMVILVSGFVVADDEIAILTQAQIDGLTNIEAYILNSCTSPGTIFIYGGQILTAYSCPYVDYNPEDDLYYVYMGEYLTSQLLQPYLDVCGTEIPLEVCEDYYWSQVVSQALHQIEGIAQTIRDYQTPEENPYDWYRDIFG